MILSPLMVALVTGLVLYFARARLARWLRIVLWIAFAAAWAVMTPLGANLFAGAYARTFAHRTCEAPLPDTIVVLGGGFDRAPDSPSDYTVFLPGTYDRLIAGIALQDKKPDRRLVLVGGGDFATAEADVMATFAKQFGVPAERITVESRSRSTWENADLARAIEPALPDRIVLVTSAIHLPRASFAFESRGFDVCPYAADSLYFEASDWRMLLPQRTALAKAEAAMHEIGGLVAYRWRSWRESE